MPNYYGKRLSKPWNTILRRADKVGVKFRLNSGRRTMAEQWRLYRLYRAGRGNLAAFPSPTAPHIRVGRVDHAIDVDSLDGGETRLQNWLRKHGVRVTNPVRGESWHMEAPASDLRRFAKQIRKERAARRRRRIRRRKGKK